jgi:hypothetical protein
MAPDFLQPVVGTQYLGGLLVCHPLVGERDAGSE